MTASRRRPWWERLALDLLRWLLWPVARARPASGWARLHARLQKLEDDEQKSPAPRRHPAPRVTPPMAVFALLVSAAAAIWIYDVIRRPPPEPARLPSCPSR